MKYVIGIIIAIVVFVVIFLNLTSSVIWPWYSFPSNGIKAVKYYNKEIEMIAQKHEINPDWLRAVMFTENTLNHRFGLGEFAYYIGLSDKKPPMNIDEKIWSDMENQKFDVNNAYQNIEISAILLKKLSRTQDNSDDLLAIGSLWYDINSNEINVFGVRIDDAYRRKLWEDNMH